MANKDYVDYINSLREIQSNVLTLNEEAEQQKQEDENQGATDADMADLEGMLNDTGGEEGGAEQAPAPDSANEPAPDDDAMDFNAGVEDSGDADEGSKEEKDTYETDTEGLVNAISKLTKSGHSVKIVLRRLAA